MLDFGIYERPWSDNDSLWIRRADLSDRGIKPS